MPELKHRHLLPSMQLDCVCIDLCKALDSYMDLDDVFPKDNIH